MTEMDSTVPEFEREMNPEQIEVIRHNDGPCVVMAVAGCGKTTSLVHRIARMVADGVDPKRILAVTFSKMAADEMNKRLVKLHVGEARVGTWHSLCLEILRRDQTIWGGWKIDDRGRFQMLLKEALGFKYMKWKDADPKAVGRYIGLCKANLEFPGSPEAMDRAHDDPRFHEAYYIVQSLARHEGLLPFDDFLMYAYQHLAGSEEARERWASRWSYVLSDEAQDSNKAQMALGFLLAKDHQNYMLIGDPAQCIPAGQLVSTPHEPKPIESLQEGDLVMAVKAGGFLPRKIVKKTKNIKSKAFEFDLGEHGKFQATAEHVLFASIDDPRGSFLYLMYRHDFGYRIGVSRTAGGHGDNFVMRTQQEGGERLWVLEWYPEYAQAAAREAFLAYKYGIPREPFVPRNGMWSGTEEATRVLFEEFGQNGRKLLEVYKLDFDRPNYFAKASLRGRINVNLILGTKDGHRVEIESGIIDEMLAISNGFIKTSRDTWRIRKTSRSLREMRKYAEYLAKTFGGNIVESLSGTDVKRRMMAVPASSVNIGMVVPIEKDGVLKSAYVLGRREVDVSDCYDLEVEDLATFVVNGVVVHNSIYKFRGSDPTFLMNFEKEWGAKTIIMNRNYRSGSTIIDAANRVIGPAKIRLPKEMVAERGTEGDVRIVSYEHEEDQARELTCWVQALMATEGAKPGDIAVIYRMNAQSRAPEEALLRARVPYKILGGVSFYERREVKNLLAYLRVAVGRGAEDDIKRCINAPFRYLGNAFVDRVLRASNNAKAKAFQAAEQKTQETGQEVAQEPLDWTQVVLDVSEEAGIQNRQIRSAEIWASLIEHICAMRDQRASNVLNWLVEKTRYIDFLREDEGKEDTENSHIANVHELIRVAHEFNSIDKLLVYVDEMEKLTKKNNSDRKPAPVVLMTIHRVKGLEYPYVFVAGVNKMVLPHIRGDAEEERRLMYVAVTRAKDKLVVGCAPDKNGDYSPFIRDIRASSRSTITPVDHDDFDPSMEEDAL
jgi:DNA helicase-2/ATP-dependent DNA helicase PcrA